MIPTRFISTSILKLHQKNPRTIKNENFDKLCKSIQDNPEYFQGRPIIASNRTGENIIIAGNMRYKAAKSLKMKEVPAIILEGLSEQKEKEIMIRDNVSSGQFDFDTLANQWDYNDLMEWGLDIEIPEGEECIIEEDSGILEPGKDEESITKLGDRYELGDHVLVCGDSTNSEIVRSCLCDNKPILMVTDPPYGVNYDASWRNGHDLNLGKGFNGKQNRAIGKVKNDDRFDWKEAWDLFPGNIAYVWHAGLFAGEVGESLRKSNFILRSQIIWVKQHFVFGRGDYHWQHEPCWYAVREKGNWTSDRKQTTVWEINNNNPFGSGSEKEEKTGHSTQKPLECMARPIKNNTAQRESIYDPFLGSGTTLIACEQLNRKCFGIELSPSYCDIIVKRWIDYRKKTGKDFLILLNGKKNDWKSDGP